MKIATKISILEALTLAFFSSLFVYMWSKVDGFYFYCAFFTFITVNYLIVRTISINYTQKLMRMKLLKTMKLHKERIKKHAR